MVSDAILTLFIISLVAITAFIVISVFKRKSSYKLIHKLFFIYASLISSWLIAIIGLRFVAPDDATGLYIADAFSNIGGAFTPVVSLYIAMTFVKGYEKLPRRYYLLLIVPLITNIMVWTNPLHHLVYEVLSSNSQETVFGPYLLFSGAYSYICSIYPMVAISVFAVKSGNSLYRKQALFYCLGNIVPFTVNCIATLQLADVSIAATPAAFIVTILFHGIAIFHFRMLDLKPVAVQYVLDSIQDCYIVVNEQDMVMGFNKSFASVFGWNYGITEGTSLAAQTPNDDTKQKSPLYNLVGAFRSCRESDCVITYEQAIIETGSAPPVKKYYMVDVSPLRVDTSVVGHIAYFRDVTKIKESMQRLQDSQSRLMEQERLASLGQMMGGIAHNLKTPIMSIAGSSTAVDVLITEAEASIGDPEITAEDYGEIYTEMHGWLDRIREACAYMSDIITVVKGQAASMSASDNDAEFDVDELIKRVQLLMRHELVAGNCRIVVENDVEHSARVHGDINNLVQVLNNLIQNAIDAMRPDGGCIMMRLAREHTDLVIRVLDRGCGLSDEVKRRLFKQMITSKGAQGTGLGVFISNSIVRGKFGGRMWFEDNPEGGTVFALTIPEEYVTYTAS